MINHSDTSQTVYDITASQYWDISSLNKEIERVYDICIGCRLCFNLCPSFPAIFDAVDNAGQRKRDEAVADGRASIEKVKDEYLDLPEGEHAAETSMEVEFRGEVSDMSDGEIWKVVDLCYQCKLCESVCPYTPGKEHEFHLEFPKLMTRAQAVRTRKNGISLSDKFLSNTDFIGKIGTAIPWLTNFVNKWSISRFIMEGIIGIHRKRVLPTFHKLSFKKWMGLNNYTGKISGVDKVVIFGSCYTNAHDPEVGQAAVEILCYNDIEVIYPDQQCCGAPYLSSGDFEGFKKQSSPNLIELAEWVDKGYKIVVTGPPTCSMTMKKEYPYILGKNKKIASAIQKVAENTFDISEYLMYLNKQGKLKTDFKHEIGSVTYHVSCHLKAQKMGFKSRDVLKLIPNTELRMINNCSGMDGGWGMKKENFDESIKVAKKCIEDIEKQSADITCTDCTLAGLQIHQVSSGRVKTEHPIIVLRRAYGF